MSPAPSTTPQQHIFGYPKRRDGLGLLVTEAQVDRQERYEGKTGGRKGNQYGALPSNGVNFCYPNPSVHLAKNILPLFSSFYLLSLITKHKEEASSSSLTTEEEMEEITLFSISPPCLTIQY